MTKTVAIPQQNNFNLVIPNQYIGKKIEIIMYALDEITEERSVKKTMADFWGTLKIGRASCRERVLMPV